MSKGTVYLAPGQRAEVIKGITDHDIEVVTDTELSVDAMFYTPSDGSFPPKNARILIEFKEVPNDLVSSIRDSQRFSRQCIALGANDGPSFLFCVGQPFFKWVFDRESGNRHFMMMGDDRRHETGLTYGEMQLRFLTLTMIGCYQIWIPTWDEVGETLANFFMEFQKANHTSHLVRPAWKGKKTTLGWRKPGMGDLIIHIMQGFEKVGYNNAKALWKFFGNMKVMALAEPEDYQMVPGIGKVIAKRVADQYSAEYSDYFDEEGNAKK